MESFYRKFLLTDNKGEKSTTLTAFVIGFIVVNVKLLIAGITIAGFQMSNFSGVDYGTSLAALGAVYVMRKNNSDRKSGEA
jgi:hypothetical protein